MHSVLLIEYLRNARLAAAQSLGISSDMLTYADSTEKDKVREGCCVCVCVCVLGPSWLMRAGRVSRTAESCWRLSRICRTAVRVARGQQ